MLWTSDWQPEDQWPREVEAGLEHRGAPVSRGSGHDRWDLTVRGGILGSARSCTASEDHKNRHQLVRVRTWPHTARLSVAMTSILGVLFVLAALDGAWLAATVFGMSLTATATVTLAQCSAAMGAFAGVLTDDGFTRRRRRSRSGREQFDVPDP
jgi:uncharacterized membrane protein (DUF485 family)